MLTGVHPAHTLRDEMNWIEICCNDRFCLRVNVIWHESS